MPSSRGCKGLVPCGSSSSRPTAGPGATRGPRATAPSSSTRRRGRRWRRRPSTSASPRTTSPSTGAWWPACARPTNWTRPPRVHVRMDSKLVVEQMSGRWKIKHPDMKPLAAEAARVFPRGAGDVRVDPARAEQARGPARQRGDGRGQARRAVVAVGVDGGAGRTRARAGGGRSRRARRATRRRARRSTAAWRRRALPTGSAPAARRSRAALRCDGSCDCRVARCGLRRGHELAVGGSRDSSAASVGFGAASSVRGVRPPRPLPPPLRRTGGGATEAEADAGAKARPTSGPRAPSPVPAGPPPTWGARDLRPAAARRDPADPAEAVLGQRRYRSRPSPTSAGSRPSGRRPRWPRAARSRRSSPRPSPVPGRPRSRRRTASAWT